MRTAPWPGQKVLASTLSRLADGLALAIKLPLRAVHGDSQQQNSCLFCTGCGRLGSNGVVEKNRQLETAGFVTARRTQVKDPRDVQVPVGQFDQAHDLMSTQKQGGRKPCTSRPRWPAAHPGGRWHDEDHRCWHSWRRARSN